MATLLSLLDEILDQVGLYSDHSLLKLRLTNQRIAYATQYAFGEVFFRTRFINVASMRSLQNLVNIAHHKNLRFQVKTLRMYYAHMPDCLRQSKDGKFSLMKTSQLQSLEWPTESIPAEILVRMQMLQIEDSLLCNSGTNMTLMLEALNNCPNVRRLHADADPPNCYTRQLVLRLTSNKRADWDYSWVFKGQPDEKALLSFLMKLLIKTRAAVLALHCEFYDDCGPLYEVFEEAMKEKRFSLRMAALEKLEFCVSLPRPLMFNFLALAENLTELTFWIRHHCSEPIDSVYCGVLPVFRNLKVLCVQIVGFDAWPPEKLAQFLRVHLRTLQRFQLEFNRCDEWEEITDITDVTAIPTAMHYIAGIRKLSLKIHSRIELSKVDTELIISRLEETSIRSLNTVGFHWKRSECL